MTGGSAFVVEPDDNLEVRVEVLVRSAYSKPGAVRLGAQPTAEEGNEPLALRERARRVIALARPRAGFLGGNGTEREQAT
jgi:hypothetical protein